MSKTTEKPAEDPKDLEIQKLRAQLDVAALNTASHQMRTVQPGARGPVSADAYVGIRNVSDNTVGIPGLFGQPDLQLNADLGEHDPGSVASIPHAWWIRMKKGDLVRNGLIVRDDSVLGEGYITIPEDRPEDLPAEAAFNVIRDPEEWITSRTEAEITEDLAKITSEQSLRRVRRGVDIAVKRLERKYGGDAARAWKELPMSFKYVDEETTTRLERPEDREVDVEV